MSHEVSRMAPAPPQPRGSAPESGRIPTPRSPDGPATEVPQDRTRSRAALSQRDRLLLEHLARGDSIRQIAEALSVSRNTARTRIRRVAAKLAVPDRGRLMRAARDVVLI